MKFPELQFENPDEKKFDIKMKAQLEVMDGVGDGDTALEWIVTNGERFDNLLNDPQYNFYNLLADEKTHEDAIKEIKNKLYN
ncbi:MAG: hypothetical protein WC791_01290 [Candidatus Paceibacterota bacterium]|jgi:hypothetical protein